MHVKPRREKPRWGSPAKVTAIPPLQKISYGALAVQALKWYLACTKALQGSVTKFLISTTNQHGAVSPYYLQSSTPNWPTSRATWPMPMILGQRPRHGPILKGCPSGTSCRWPPGRHPRPTPHVICETSSSQKVGRDRVLSASGVPHYSGVMGHYSTLLEAPPPPPLIGELFLYVCKAYI